MITSLKSRVANMTPKQKIWIAAVVLVLIVTSIVCNFLISKAATVAQAKVLEQVDESINGKITVGSMDVSLLGTIYVNQVAIYDQHNNLLGKTDKIKVEFSLSDLLSGKVDSQALKSITVENPTIIISQQDGKWNWENILKPKPEQPFSFRGQVSIKQGVVSLNSPDNRKVEAITGTLSFAAYPSFTIEFTGKKDSIPLSAKGAWIFNGDGAVDIKAEKVPLTDVPLDLLAQADVKISNGTIDTLAINVAKQSGKFTFAGEGSISGLAATAAGYDISQGIGNFKLNNNSAAIQNASLQLNGQMLSLDGTVALVDNVALNLNIAANNFDPSVLAGPSFQGPITFQANIQGTPSSPQAQGQFSIPQGEFSTLTFSAASGNFAYSEGTLTLQNTQAAMWDGTLLINGTVLPISQQYNLAITGSGIDSALLSNKDIHGRADFDAEVSGQGTTGMAAIGSFRMGEGNFYGVPFLSMIGNFIKHGEQINFTNIDVTTIAGSFAATGFSEGSVIKLQKSDMLIDNPITNARETINQTITNQLKKLRP